MRKVPVAATKESRRFRLQSRRIHPRSLGCPLRSSFILSEAALFDLDGDCNGSSIVALLFNIERGILLESKNDSILSKSNAAGSSSRLEICL